ncbi:MAG: DNA-protecting protein DprA [Candidatus Marinimicrobia bacterium]|nr:DNA-protecting protein DprA [Candidatus Neomarinimicrobiota bacterium]
MIPAEVYITLDQVPGLGPRKVRNIFNAYPSISSWADLLSADLTIIDGLSSVLSSRIHQADSGKARAILDSCEQLGTQYIALTHASYPPLLAELYDAPSGIYIRGAGRLDADYIAVVGTRRASDYGRQATRELTAGMVASGLGIVSGMARGIDSAAHQAALDAGGITAAILGTGVDVVYPAENRKLFDQLIERGLLISEYPPGTKPEGHHFPQRNRIISGLALGTLVVEAGKGSGALITAVRSMDQNREVFAVPGRVDDARSAGCHALIQDGAKLVMRIEDIFSELQPPYSAGPGEQIEIIRDLPPPEQKVLGYLSREPVIVDKIAEDLSWNISELLSLLMTMELQGLVVQSAGKRYSKV